MVNTVWREKIGAESVRLAPHVEISGLIAAPLRYYESALTMGQLDEDSMLLTCELIGGKVDPDDVGFQKFGKFLGSRLKTAANALDLSSKPLLAQLDLPAMFDLGQCLQGELDGPLRNHVSVVDATTRGVESVQCVNSFLCR